MMTNMKFTKEIKIALVAIFALVVLFFGMQFLKGLSIINWLLRPLSWAFKAELVGKPDDYQWHLRSGWRKLEDKDE